MQRIDCGGCHDFKVITTLDGASFGEWEKQKFAPEAEFLEALEKAAIEHGLPEGLAAIFARETIIGSAALLENSNDTPTKLRKNVTSPKGTTEAALKVLMKKNGLEQLIDDTVNAAIRRSKNLD